MPSFSILIAAALALSRSGGLRVSHRKQASALVIAAAMGCLISCASDAVSSPIILTRLTCARSASTWRNLSRSCSARLRSVMSTWVPTNSINSPLALKTGWPSTWMCRTAPSGSTILNSSSKSVLARTIVPQCSATLSRSFACIRCTTISRSGAPCFGSNSQIRKFSSDQ